MTAWMLASLSFSTLLACAAVVGDRAAARFGAARRFIWIALIVIGTLASTASAVRPSRSVAITDTDFGVVAVRRVASSAAVPLVASVASTSAMRLTTARARGALSLLDRWAAALWIVGSLALLARLVGGLLWLRRERKGWTEAHELVGPVFVTRDAGPAVTGVIRPRIVMPGWMLNEDSATRTLLLQHEVEHVRAGDTRLLFGAAVLEVLFPWNAALLWMVRRLRLAIEIDCDRRVVRAVGSARRYGLALLAASERYATPLPVAACLHESPIDLEVRIDALTRRARRRPVAAGVAMSGIGAAAISIAACMPWPSLRSGSAAPVAAGARGAPGAPNRLSSRAASHPVTTRITPAFDTNRVAAPTRNAQVGAFAALPAPGDKQIAPHPLTNDRVPPAKASADVDSLPPMHLVLDWFREHHPDVVSGESHMNRVTFIVDSLGRYVRSVADSVRSEITAPIDSEFAFVAKRNEIDAMTEKPLYVVDGKRVASLDGLLAPGRGETMVLLDSTDAMARYGPDAVHGAAVVATFPTDPNPWKYAVGSTRIETMMMARPRPGVIAPNRVYIVVLRVRDATAQGDTTSP